MALYPSFIVPTTLASSADYASWSGLVAPANIVQVLRSCTALILDATEGAIYDVNPTTGLATDPATLAALRDATCIQASAWVALNIDPTTGGVLQTSKAVRSKKLATGAIEYSDAEVQAVAAARAAAYVSLVPEAARFLQQRNLLGAEPAYRG
ncbi:hypothetical protein [Microbacterium sp. MYb64]|uniref:hypothetical protein n=1 Tax=Microbacterium sp. MYb64 TaxID=1848691 RepID=UPI000CFD400E|nr:hypothetical protein [Microbacterium sp. MYb64]PRB01756.1 hypothetical protein CQ044_16540 [Microbacterium sp. MYb64]